MKRNFSFFLLLTFCFLLTSLFVFAQTDLPTGFSDPNEISVTPGAINTQQAVDAMTTNYEKMTGKSAIANAQAQCRSILEGRGIEGSYTMGSVNVGNLFTAYSAANRGGGGGGSTVPVIDQAAISVLSSIFSSSENGNQLLNNAWAELRRLNFGLFCVQAVRTGESIEEYKNLASKIARADETYKLKDPDFLLNRLTTETCKKVVDNPEYLNGDNEKRRIAAEYCQSLMTAPTPEPPIQYELANKIAINGPSSLSEFRLARDNSWEKSAFKTADVIDSLIIRKRNIINNDVERYGVVGLYECTELEGGGGNPAQTLWVDAACKNWKQKLPASLVLEQNKILVNAPFDALLSPAAILGPDLELSNITNSIYSGVAGEAPWQQRGIAPNFAQSVSGNPYYSNVNTSGGGDNLGINSGVGYSGGGGWTGGGGGVTWGGGGGGSSGGGGNSGGSGGRPTTEAEIANALKTKDALLKNINSILSMYTLVQTYYSSSTSACVVLPLARRTATISSVEKTKAPIQERKTAIEKRWQEVITSPNSDHSEFFTQMSVDLGQTFNNDFIKKVYDASKALLKICTDAKAGITTTTTTTTTNN